MPDAPELTATLAEIARRCHEETDRFFNRLAPDTRFCYELFRRALASRDSDALQHVIANYAGLVDRWIRRHPGFPTAGEESSFFVIAAFEKLWIAVPPARFGRFPDLKALLAYLKLCAHSALVDHLRSIDDMASLDDDTRSGALDPAAPVTALSGAERAEIWAAVAERLQTDKERTILRACFGLGMKPSEVAMTYSHLFESVNEVYRVKQNLLERLRRDQALRSYLEPYA